ncbi:hypothetical protein JTF08_15200 [Micrococcaceae bacterium RIT802]|nr:hypothetical protein [Micrococcaceae bacterium RIT 802]
MGLGDNLGGLGENIENLKNEHGDQINQGIDGAQEKFGDKFPADAEQIDGAQEKFLGGGDNQDEGQ